MRRRRVAIVCSIGASLASLAVAVAAGGQQAPRHLVIGEVRPVTYPAYDTYRGIERYAPTAADYTRAISDRRFVMERLTYRSDDLDVFAYLYRPASPEPGAVLPVAAVYGTITDFSRFIAAGTPARAQAAQIWPGFPANEADIVESRSALRWPERITMPVLIMHGGADNDVPPSHALQLASALQALGRPYELKIFEGQRHVLSSRAAERDADAVRWFRAH